MTKSKEEKKKVKYTNIDDNEDLCMIDACKFFYECNKKQEQGKINGENVKCIKYKHILSK